MEWLTSNSTFMMERSMNFLWTKQRAILDNISNVETPGYKTKYVTFEEALADRLRAASGGARPVSAYRSVLERSGPLVREAEPESARMDENGVNAVEQGVELARNAYQLQFVMDSINSDLNTLRIAIRG